MAAQGHALLGPSSSHRWLNCTPSARLEENVSEKSSDFAQEGSCAHALCEEKLWTLIDDSEKSELARQEQIANDYGRWYTNEMETCAEDYASIVWNKYQDALKHTKDALIFIERTLNFERWIPSSFGTADAIIVADGLMEVIDFKYGKGVEVSAINNSQMMVYALGAINEFEDLYDIRNIRCTIVQPRLSNVSEYDISIDDLLKWGEDELKPNAEAAWNGSGEQKPGEWCRFCKIKAKCSKLANQAIAAYTQHECKEQISDADYPKILGLIPAIKAWVSAVEDYATAKAIEGHEFNGYKLVEGRSIRKVSDTVGLAERLIQNGYEDVYKPKELLSISELEKKVGKKEFAKLSDGLVVKPKGKPTLVPNSDKRQPMQVSGVEDFSHVELSE